MKEQETEMYNNFNLLLNFVSLLARLVLNLGYNLRF